jgi:predicted nucleic acid-binding protein
LRDIDDLPVLGTLLAALKTSDVDYLITGDKDLLVMGERYPIVTPASFWATHAGL